MAATARGDMAVRMRKILARPWVGVRVCPLLLLFFLCKHGLIDNTLTCQR